MTILLGFALLFPATLYVSAGDKWLSARSQNFHFVGNAPENEIRKIATELEGFRNALTFVDDRLNVESRSNTVILIFKDNKSFSKFKPVKNGEKKDWVAGFFQSGSEVNYIVVSLGVTDFRQTIFHEYIHLVLQNTFKKSKVPSWVNEGLAEYYENLDFDRRSKLNVGGAKPAHIKLLQKDALISIEDLAKRNDELFEGFSKNSINRFYAQSWALVHYLMNGKSQMRTVQFSRFIDLLIVGTKAELAFDEIFYQDTKSLESELRNYVQNTTISSKEIEFRQDQKANSQYTVELISEATAKSYQGDLLFRMERIVEAEQVLKEALILEPESEMGNIAMGLVSIKNQDFENAKNFMSIAVSAGSKNYIAHFNYAFALSRETVTRGGVINRYGKLETNEIRASLLRSIELNPNYAEAYNLYTLVSLVQNDELDTGLEMINRAILIEPENEMFKLRKSEIFLRKKEFEHARNLASEISKSTLDEKTREFSQSILRQVDNAERRVEIADQINESNKYLVDSDKSLSEKELSDLYKKIEIDSIRKNLRDPRDGERRVSGLIEKISCDVAGVSFLIKSGETNLIFVNSDFNDILFFTYQIALKGGMIGCDSELHNYQSVITYKESIETKKTNDGKIVSVEFVPEYFAFEASKPD